MNEEINKKKKSLLRRLIRVVLYVLLFLSFLLVAAYLFFWWLFSGLNDQMVDTVSLRNSLGGEAQNLQMTWGELKDYESRRDVLAYNVNAEINAYYKRTGFYPKSLNDLPIAKTDKFIKYNRGIFYYSGKQDKPQMYKLHWLSISPWNGKQCVGGIPPTDASGFELTGELAKLESGGCCSIDYH